MMPMGCGASDEYPAVPEYRADGALPFPDPEPDDIA